MVTQAQAEAPRLTNYPVDEATLLKIAQYINLQTGRKQQVAEGVYLGYMNGEIAEELRISLTEVSTIFSQMLKEAEVPIFANCSKLENERKRRESGGKGDEGEGV